MNSNGSLIIPTLRYKDAPVAIEWLCKAFGFKKHLVVPGENGTITHAQLIIGNSMIMLGTEKDDDYGKLLWSPKTLKGSNTQAPYIIVDKVDAHYQIAKAAGAEIVMDIKDEDYGGRGYTCKDPEGYVWSFGSYNPWVD